MLPGYNPFNKRHKVCNTNDGLINYYHDLGTVYVTHRSKNPEEQIFDGFMIAKSELVIAFNERVHWVLVIDHEYNGTSKVYRIRIDLLNFLEATTIKDVEYVMIPKRSMECKHDDEWR